MIHLSLPGHSERIHPDEGFFPEEFSRRGYFPLYAQWRTYDALVSGNASIVMNSYATGSGKTKAALLYLRELRRKPLPRANCLVIAPTNELLQQHARDIRGFCETNLLDYQVLPLTRAYMDEYAELISEAAPEMTRRAAKMVEVLKNPRVLPDANGGAANEQRPYVLVTNPDIFYYAVYNGYGRNEERELMKQFLGNFNYLVIDEFHYYNPKQLANFLFFLSVWRHYGFFENGGESGAKVCLLSATPNARVRDYLHSLEVPIEEISPGNEPKESDVPSIVSLAPVEFDAVSLDEARDGGLMQIVRERAGDLRRWLDEDRQGAIISSALWRINLIYYWLRRTDIAADRFARLTGVETRHARTDATRRDLILATPTVDLGYNFERTDKSRQSLDFLFFDAAFADEFVQRLGRAGRVLGKRETGVPSRVLAVLPNELIEVLRPLQGRPVSRAELRIALDTAITEGQLQERNTLFDYIASGAIEEAFLPILRLREMAGSTDLTDIQALYERVRAHFQAQASDRYRFGRLEAITKRFKREREVFRRAPTDPQDLAEHLLKLPEDKAIRLWLQTMSAERGVGDRQPPTSVITQMKGRVDGPEAPNRAAFVEWAVKAQMEYAVREASFSFRESFEEPLARIYDPDHFVSSSNVADYSLFHVVQNCHLDVLTPTQWSERSGKESNKTTVDQIVVHCAVRDLRDYEHRLRLRFRLQQAGIERRAWEQDHVCKMTALSDVEVFAETDQLPAAVMDAVRTRFIPAFLAPQDSWIGGKLIGLARSQGMRYYTILVTFAGGRQEYLMLLGTSALLVAARLRRECAIYHHAQEKDFHEPIWC